MFIYMKKFLFTIAIFLSYNVSAFAADLSVVAPASISDSKTFPVLVNLDTGGILINSVDVTISYPKDILLFKGYKEENSIKKLWLAPPTEALGSIHFSGIIPGGVDGVYDPDKHGLQPLPIIELLFSAKSDGKGDFIVTGSSILQNDGFGSTLSHKINNATIMVVRNPISIDEEIQLEKNTLDVNPPEPFILEYIKASFFSKTPAMVMFSTTDIESGIEKYQIKERNDSWKDIASPYPVRKALLQKDLEIRALDFSGNAREARIEIPGLLSSLQLFVILILGVICYFIYFVVKRKR